MKKYSITSKYTAAVPRSQRRKNVEGRSVVAGYSAGGGSGVDRSYVDANFVTLATEQVVTAHKDFAAGISMYGIPWEYDVERDTWTIKGNVIITKGLATYSALKEDDVLSVFDGLPIDNDTLQWQETENGKILVAVGGGTGGGLDESKLQDYLDREKYVTESWIAGKSYYNSETLTKSVIKTKLGISSWALESSKPSYAFSEITNKPTTLSGYGITNAYTKTEVEENFLALAGGQLTGDLEVYKSTAYIWANNNGANSIGLRAGHDVGLRHRNSSNVERWALAIANSGKGMWTRFPLAVNMSVDEPRSDYSLYVNGDSYTTGTFYLNGAPLTYNSSKNAWQLEGNLIVTGGLATYSTLTGVDLEECLTTAGGTVSGAILPNSSNTISLGAVGNEWQTVYARSIQAKAGWGIRFYTGASGATPTPKMMIGTSGRVAIGTESASELLHVAGNIYVTGTVTENSARKLKDVEYEGEGIALDVLKKVKVAKWHWKDERDDKLHIGAIADDLINIIPEVVVRSVSNDGVETTGIAYGKAGFSIAASLIAPVARHEDRIKELEKNIEKMQKELNQLRRTA